MKRRESVAVRVIGLLVVGMIIYSLTLFSVINRRLTSGFLNYMENTLVYQSEGVQNYIDDISAELRRSTASLKESFNEGFYVTSENAIEFLEEKLSYIGLNDRERNEFIMYWLPILEKNGKNLVYFELTNERNSYSKINISPKVDSMLRIAIHVKRVNSEVNIKEQKLTKFNRVGVSGVEWG